MDFKMISEFMWMKDAFVELTMMKAIKNKETCPHWIDYEIYEALPEDLARKYLEQFEFPTICLSKGSGEEEFSNKILCKPRDNEIREKVHVDCSSCYPKTLGSLFKDFGHIGVE